MACGHYDIALCTIGRPSRGRLRLASAGRGRRRRALLAEHSSAHRLARPRSEALPGAGVTEKQLAAAGMLGRGRSTSTVAETLGISARTIERWQKLAGFAAEVARVRGNSERPTPRGVLLDALSARRDDGIDWSV
jgi:hypothetical protein